MTALTDQLGLSESDIHRFYRFVSAEPEGCREWTGARQKDPHRAWSRRYGLFSWHPVKGDRRTRTMSAHRLAFTLANDRMPAGHVCHTCDNEPCCHPDHLYDGTAATNKADQIRRGRHAFGDRVNTAKLSDADVLAIRAEWARRPRPSKRALARRYGITPVSIGDVVDGKTWKHLLPPKGSEHS